MEPNFKTVFYEVTYAEYKALRPHRSSAGCAGRSQTSESPTGYHEPADQVRLGGKSVCDLHHVAFIGFSQRQVCRAHLQRNIPAHATLPVVTTAATIMTRSTVGRIFLQQASRSGSKSDRTRSAMNLVGSSKVSVLPTTSVIRALPNQLRALSAPSRASSCAPSEPSASAIEGSRAREGIPVDALHFKTFAECGDASEKTWLIEGVFALGEDSSWWGPSGVGKSTFLVEGAVYVASERDWRGHRFVRYDHQDPEYSKPHGVVIFATERAKLTERRLAAYKQRENLPADLPIVVVNAPINLMDPACVNQISDTIYQFEYEYGCKVGLVIFDSWSKCLGGNDETLPQVQNTVAANITRIRDRYSSEFHVASVGHSGKNIEAGERGSSARRAHVNFAVKIYGEGKVKTAKVDKANDGIEGITLATFETEELSCCRFDGHQV